MKKLLICFALLMAVSACSDSGSTSLPNGSLSVSKLTWQAVCTDNNGVVNSAGECIAAGESLVPAEVCGFTSGILDKGECVYPNTGKRPCGGAGQCVYDNSTNQGQCIYDNVTGTSGCQFHGTHCQLNPDGTPICGNNPDNCTNKKTDSPRYRYGWQDEHRSMHGQGNGNGHGGNGGNGNGNGGGRQ